ncbi:MAG TPA: tyrosine-type recombinase/integrase, partial [Candidatus Eisenbacteria bacterium]|nr:tyrosine-type recombinase/integrase [Candidatus Eisenbacteria bacterium]
MNCPPRIKYLDRDQLAALFRVARERGPRDLLLVTMLYRYGCRISEALSLQVSDLDIKRGEVTVVGFKGGYARTYALGRDVLPTLRRYRPTGPFLFASRQGVRLSRTRAY